MANPIIVDCGGSTRLKRLDDGGGIGAMNKLLDVDPTLTPPSSTEVIKRAFARVAIASIDKEGVATQPLPSGPVAANDIFTITSENGQSVELKIDATNSSLTITVKGQRGNPPLMEAKHFNNKRRYVAINAGAIQSIVGTANGKPLNFNAIAAKSIYATLVLNEP